MQISNISSISNITKEKKEEEQKVDNQLIWHESSNSQAENIKLNITRLIEALNLYIKHNCIYLQNNFLQLWNNDKMIFFKTLHDNEAVDIFEPLKQIQTKEAITNIAKRIHLYIIDQEDEAIRAINQKLNLQGINIDFTCIKLKGKPITEGKDDIMKFIKNKLLCNEYQETICILSRIYATVDKINTNLEEKERIILKCSDQGEITFGGAWKKEAVFKSIQKNYGQEVATKALKDKNELPNLINILAKNQQPQKQVKTNDSNNPKNCEQNEQYEESCGEHFIYIQKDGKYNFRILKQNFIEGQKINPSTDNHIPEPTGNKNNYLLHSDNFILNNSHFSELQENTVSSNQELGNFLQFVNNKLNVNGIVIVINHYEKKVEYYKIHDTSNMRTLAFNYTDRKIILSTINQYIQNPKKQETHTDQQQKKQEISAFTGHGLYDELKKIGIISS